ncbi:MAG: extracellular solute-binding protein [Planctomycetes bacterium]|nr:extracellular solute-binding protein [Planctomycetota bacterium]
MKRRVTAALAVSAAVLAGCPTGPAPAAREVVVYCALDRLYAEPILEAFTARTGIAVKPKWDAEATKTTGLVEAIRAERDRPRCDVFWNNEVGQTIGLAREGLLEPYASPAAAGLPPSARDPEGRWTGFAARARVLIVNTDLVPEAEQPTSYRDLVDPRWKGRAGIAGPLFGTTATHVAALFAALGPDEAKAWMRALHDNEVLVCAGNATVKDKVAAGELAFGLTDTDDVNLALLAGKPVRAVFPDQADGALGTLLIPNSVAVIKGAPRPAEARALVDHLLSPEVEAALAASRSAQVPLRPGAPRAAWIPAELRTFPVTWDQVADAFAAARAFGRDEFLRR